MVLFHPLVLRLFCLGLLALTAVSGTARAESSRWDKNEHAAVRLISAVDGTRQRETLPLGLEFKLEPGWKIYWRTPGDAGLPPIPDWNRSRNVADARFSWPTPKRFSIFGLQTFGYKDHVILPITVTPDTPGAPVSLGGTVHYLACADICVPHTAELDLPLPAAPAGPSDEAQALNRFEGQVPVAADAAGISVEHAAVATTATETDGVALSVDFARKAGFSQPDLIVEGPAGSYFNPPEVAISQDGTTARLTVTGGGATPEALSAGPLTLTLLDKGYSVETQATPVVGPPPAQTTRENGFWGILALALLGGLILNLMPCVLPVLSIKLLSVMGHGGGDKGHVRLGFTASAAGIVTAFLILAGILSGLKSAGVAIGWGIQFQQPVFLATMVAILTLFTANLLGLFEIRLPGRVSGYAATAGTHRKGLVGHFVTGLFVTVLATPCTAPFLGTAVGFALSRGPLEIFSIFAALGIGLAAPYLLVALVPRLATALPRPGPWMVKVKWGLALALLATAVWLLAVINTIAGHQTALPVAAIAVLTLAVLAVRVKLPEARLARRAPAVVAVLVAAGILVPIIQTPQRQASSPSAGPTEAIAWTAFQRDQIRNHVAAGRTVFVDVTADWCITCQFNKANTLESAHIAAWLNSPGIVAMQADWTQPDAHIAQYLKSFGRYGIPFNVVYGPDAPDGIVLPELLTVDAVVTAAETADPNARIAEY